MKKKSGRVYSSSEIGKATGLNARQIQFLTENGVLVPVEGGGQRGRARQFTAFGVVEALLAAKLMKFGVTVRVIKNFIEDFRAKPYRYTVSMVDSESGKRAYPYLIFYIDTSAKEGYQAIFVPNGGNKAVAEMERKEIPEAFMINFRYIHEAIEGL
jgi:DNA-binding transcriptional MerR regulator